METNLHPAAEAALQRQLECAKTDKVIVDALFEENKQLRGIADRMLGLLTDWQYTDESNLDDKTWINNHVNQIVNVRADYNTLMLSATAPEPATVA
jgi:hypothetical protein